MKSSALYRSLIKYQLQTSLLRICDVIMFSVDSSDVIATSHSPHSTAFVSRGRSSEPVDKSPVDLSFTQTTELDEPTWRVLAQFHAAQNWNQEMIRTAALAAAYRSRLTGASTVAVTPTDVTTSGVGTAGRSKTIARESTNTLKAWLVEHIKNPYPSKGEKIMLAVMTRMTLTQVSTWFANARRRLKKENRVRWRDEEDDDDCDVSAVADEDDASEDDYGDDLDDTHYAQMKRNSRRIRHDTASESGRSVDDTFVIDSFPANSQRTYRDEVIMNHKVRTDGLELPRTDRRDYSHLAARLSHSPTATPLDLHRVTQHRRSVSPPSEWHRTTSSSRSSGGHSMPGDINNCSMDKQQTSSSNKPKIWSIVELITASDLKDSTV